MLGLRSIGRPARTVVNIGGPPPSNLMTFAGDFTNPYADQQGILNFETRAKVFSPFSPTNTKVFADGAELFMEKILGSNGYGLFTLLSRAGAFAGTNAYRTDYRVVTRSTAGGGHQHIRIQVGPGVDQSLLGTDADILIDEFVNNGSEANHRFRIYYRNTGGSFVQFGLTPDTPILTKETFFIERTATDLVVTMTSPALGSPLVVSIPLASVFGGGTAPYFLTEGLYGGFSEPSKIAVDNVGVA